MFEPAIHFVKPLAGRLLERTLNRALLLDQESHQSLLQLESRSIQIHCTSPPIALQLQVRHQRLCVGPVERDHEPDLAVRAPLFAFVRPLLMRFVGEGNDLSQSRAQHHSVHMAGDAALAYRLQRIVAQFDPDWQRPWTHVFGDVLGVLLANRLQSALKQACAGAIACAHTVAVYLTEESRDVVSITDYAAFHADVEQLENDVNQLIERYAQHHRQKAQR